MDTIIETRKKYKYYIVERSHPGNQEQKFTYVPEAWVSDVIESLAVIRYPNNPRMYSAIIIKGTDSADFAKSYAAHCNTIVKERNGKTFKDNEPLSFEQKSPQLIKPIQSPYFEINNENATSKDPVKNISDQPSITKFNKEKNEEHSIVVETTNHPIGITKFKSSYSLSLRSEHLPSIGNHSLNKNVVINNEEILNGGYVNNVNSKITYGNQLSSYHYTPQIIDKESPLKIKLCRKSLDSANRPRMSNDKKTATVVEQHFGKKKLSHELRKHLTKGVQNISQPSKHEHVIPSSSSKDSDDSETRFEIQANTNRNIERNLLSKHEKKKSVDDVSENLRSNPIIKKLTLNLDYSVELFKFKTYVNDILEDPKKFEVIDWMTDVHSEMKTLMGNLDILYKHYKDASIDSESIVTSSQQPVVTSSHDLTPVDEKDNECEIIEIEPDIFLEQRAKNYIVGQKKVGKEDKGEESCKLHFEVRNDAVQIQRAESHIREAKEPLKLRVDKTSNLSRKNSPRPFVLPKFYNKYNSKCTLKYQKEAEGLVELVQGSGIYVSHRGLNNCKQFSKDSKEFARGLLSEVFLPAALSTCSLLGGGKRSKNKGTARPGLDSCALRWLLKAVTMHARENNWELLKTPQQIKFHRACVLRSLRNKLTSMRRLSGFFWE